MERVAMIFAPHPDDAEIGMGGTIQSLLAGGVRVVLVDMTDGEPTPFGSPEIRASETFRASTILGIHERLNLGIKNREIFDTVENRKKVANSIRTYKPELLFIPYWEDAHPDHVNACALVEAARFYSKFVKSDLNCEPHSPRRVFHYFSTHMKVHFKPAVIVDVSRFLDGKIRAIEAYESQFKVNRGNQHRISEIEIEARYWGSQIGVAAGEPFACRENVRILNPSILLDV